MTVSVVQGSSGPYYPNGVTVAFPFDFRVVEHDDVTVVLIAADGSEAVVDPAAYSVSVNPSGEGGTVTFSAPPAATVARLFVLLDPSFEQQTLFEDEGPFNSAVLNPLADRAAMRDIVLRERLDRTFTLPRGGGQDGKFPVILPGNVPGWTSGTGSDAALRSDLALMSGASLLGFSHTVDYAAESLGGKLKRERVSITDRPWGCVGDNATDNTAGLKACAEYCIANGLTMYIPTGIYRHKAIALTPLIHSGLRVEGEWVGNYNPQDGKPSGSYLRQIDDGWGWLIDGDYGPFYLRFEGVCFWGTGAADGAVQVVGRSQFAFQRCGFIFYSKSAYPSACILITRNAEPFVGVVKIDDCIFAYSAKGILMNKSLTNVVNITGNTFIDVKSCIAGEYDFNGRTVNILSNYFEGSMSLESCVYFTGHVLTLNIMYSYVEQNSEAINSPLFNLTLATMPSEQFGCVTIAYNFIQKKLGQAGASLISAQYQRGLRITNNYVTEGNALDRWFAIVQGCPDSYIEFPSAPNGKTSYPIRNTDTGRYYLRSHYTNEDKVLATLALAGSGDADGANATTRNDCRYADRDGEITVDFDVTLTTKSGTASGFAELRGLPVPCGEQPGAVQIYQAAGMTGSDPISGVIEAGTQKIKLFNRNGQQFDFNGNMAAGTQLRGKAVYRRR